MLATGPRDDIPDYDYTDDVLLTVYPGGAGTRTVPVSNPRGAAVVTFTIVEDGDGVTVHSDSAAAFRARRAGGDTTESAYGKATLS